MKKTITIKVNGNTIATKTTSREVNFVVVRKVTIERASQMVEYFKDKSSSHATSKIKWANALASGYLIIAMSSNLNTAQSALNYEADFGKAEELSITSEIE